VGGWSQICMNNLRLMRIIVKASVSKKGLFTAVAANISAAMLAHAGSYVSPPVDLNTFKNQCATLTSWQALAKNRVTGAATQRDQALAVVAASLELLRAFVEQLCNASPEQAGTLAQGAGMYISSSPPRAKVPLRAKQGTQSGTVVLIASAAILAIGKGGYCFNWQSSIDGGKTWVSWPTTPTTKTTVTGLPALTEVLFRVSCTQRKTGQGPWTAPVPFIVH
jgi:hypothetical protein